MTRLYIAAAIAALALGAVAWAYRAGVTGERARIEALQSQTTITNTEAFNEAADSPDAGNSWFDRLFPGGTSE